MRRPPWSNFLYACLPQPVLQLLCRESGEGIILAVFAVDCHSGEQRDLAHGKAVDVLQAHIIDNSSIFLELRTNLNRINRFH